MLEVSLYNEAQSGELARAIRQEFAHDGVGISGTNGECLEAREGSTRAEIDFLACEDSLTLQRVWFYWVVEGGFEVSLGQGGESCAVDFEVWVGLYADVDDFVGNGLTLSVAVKPEEEVSGVE